VYIIYADHFDKAKFGSELYIGEGDDVRARLTNHHREKRYWNRVLIYTSQEMNIAISKNVENRFITKAKMANWYLVENSNQGVTPKLGGEDRQCMESYANTALDLTSLMQIDIFSTNTDGLYIRSDLSVNAQLRIDLNKNQHVILTKGSRFNKNFLPDSDIEEQGLEKHIRRDGDWRVFDEEYSVKIENSVIPQICLTGISLLSLQNKCGVKLAEFLKSLPSDESV
jgi:hypothetical protein